MNTNTGMIQVFANDRTPLAIQRTTAKHVDDIKNNTEWLFDQLSKYEQRNSITTKDVNTSMDFLLASKLALYVSKAMRESTLGCMFQGVTTIEELNDGVSFTLSFLINTSKNNVKIDGAIPKTSLTTMDRKIVVGDPLKVKTEVSKDVFRIIAEFLKIVNGYWLEAKERVAIGGPLYHPKDNEKSMLTHSNYNNFMKLANTHSWVAADLLTALDNTIAMIKVGEWAPSSTVLRSKGEAWKNVRSIQDIAKRTIASKSQQTFAMAKHIPGQVTSEMNTCAKALFEFLSVYMHNSDNDGAMPDLMPRFSGEGARFEHPDVIICAPGSTIAYLLKIGLAQKNNVNMHQRETKLTLSQNDMNPINLVAPQNSVTLKNGSYVRDDKRQLQVEEVVQQNHELITAVIGGIRAVFVDLDGNPFVDSVARKSGLRNMTTIDRVLPCGILFTKKGIAPDGPVRQTTTFTNEDGSQYTLGASAMMKFLTRFFEDAPKEIIAKNIDEDATNALSSMVFYRLNEGGDQLLLNTYMVDNHYYNPDLMYANLVSVLENSTARELTFLFNNIDGYDKEDDDDPRPAQAAAAGRENAEQEEDGDGETLEQATMRRDAGDVWTPQTRRNTVDRAKSYCSQKNITIAKKIIYNVYDALMKLTNVQAISCLDFINPGFGLYFLRTSYYQTDSLLACRPNGFIHVTGPTQQRRVEDPPDKSQMINYESFMHAVTGRQSLAGYPAVKWQDAKIIQSQTLTDDRVVDPTDEMDISQYLTHEASMRLAAVEDKQQDPNCVKGDGWIMFFTAPFVDRDVVSKPFTPVGRLATPYITPEDHARDFFDQSQMDCQHTTVYTHNTVHSNMRNNINTMFLWKNRFEDSDFPGHKYVAFNPTSADAIKAQIDAETRASRVQKNQQYVDELDIHPINESNISHFTGVAYPVYCYSSLNRKLGTMATDDIKFANGHRVKIMNMEGSDFLLNGSAMFGKWDNQTSEYSFDN